MATPMKLEAKLVPNKSFVHSRWFYRAEGEVTNEFERSHEFDQSVWTKYNCSVTANMVSNPIEATYASDEADKIVEDGSTGNHYIYQSVTVDGVSSYTFSVFAKAAERNWIALFLANNGFPSDVRVFFNLEDGTVGTIIGTPDYYGIEELTNGWYYCWVTDVSSSNVSSDFRVYMCEADNDVSHTGDTASGIYLWQAQLETSPFPTSSISTAAVTASRSAADFYISEEDVPATARGSFTTYWLPPCDVTINEEYQTFFKFADSVNPAQLQMSPDGCFVLSGLPSGNFNTPIVDYVRNQLIGITVEPEWGTLTVKGLSSNNGTIVGGNWLTTDGDLHWCRNEIGLHNYGLLTLPCTRTTNVLEFLTDFDNGTFANTSKHYAPYGTDLTEFDADTQAIIEIDSTDFILMEREVENLLTYSQHIFTWSATQTSVVTNAITAPDGTLTADKIVEDMYDTNHYVSNTATPDGTSTYCYSVYVKAAGRDEILLWVTTAGFPDAATCYYNLSTGAVGTEGAGIDSSGIDDVGGGWYRCWLTSTSEANVETTFIVYLADTGEDFSYQGDGVSGVYVWNPQLEIGVAPTSPIETSSVSVTRDADEQTFTSSDYISFICTKKHAIRWVPGYSSNDIMTAGYFYYFYDSASSKHFRLQINSSGVVSVWEYDSGWTERANTTTIVFSREDKITIVCDPVEGTVEVFGAASGGIPDTIGTWDTFIPTTSDLHWGSDYQGDNQINSFISKAFVLVPAATYSSYYRSNFDTLTVTDTFTQETNYVRSDSDTIAVTDYVDGDIT